MHRSHVVSVTGALFGAVAIAIAAAAAPLSAQSLAVSGSDQGPCSFCSADAAATPATRSQLGLARGDTGATSPAEKDDDWHFTVAPYLLIPTMSGTTQIGNLPQVKINATPSEIFSHLQIGGMLYFQASKGPWSFALDGIYMDLKQKIAPDSSRVSGSVNMQQGLLEGFVFRHISKPVELMIGGLGVHIQAGLTANLAIGDTIQIQKAKSAGEAWGDPVIGARWTPLDEDHWHVMVFGDIGGLSSSNWTWQALASGGYRFSRLFELALQYRALDANYSTGSGMSTFKYNVLTFGPQLGFLFHI